MLMKELIEAYINEIGFAHKLGKLSVSDKEIIANAKQDGTIGSDPVMVFSIKNTMLYFFTDGKKIDALVLLADDKNLKAIKNFSNNKGIVFSLINYLVNIKNKKLFVLPNEPLTDEGFDWINKLIKTKSGVKVSSLDGSEIDILTLKSEWEKSKQSGGIETGSTGLVISESSIEWKMRLQENEKSLIPYKYFSY